MIEQSAGLNFFLKSPKNKCKIRSLYLRVTIDGIPKETSTKRKWDVSRWDQKTERAIGTKEDARSVNYYLQSLTRQINNYKTELFNKNIPITAQRIIDHIKGNDLSRVTVVSEFQAHNDEMLALVSKGEYSAGTHSNYVRTLSRIKEFIKFKYNRNDMEFRELNYEFVADFEFFLKTVRNCQNNTAMKRISIFKKIVLCAVAKEIIPSDPFIMFKKKWTKSNKKPLSWEQLLILEQKEFSTERLTVTRDVFVFQCYTGLAYIDVYQLKKIDIQTGIDGKLWIMSSRQKSDATTDIPLLPKAIEILEKYKDDPICKERGSVLPVRSNQKMNEYLKEIATLCGFDCTLNTHKVRRTFASTVTLAKGVPIHVVKEMLGHSSVKQTEEYAITEQQSISKEMIALQHKLKREEGSKVEIEPMAMLSKLEEEIHALKKEHHDHLLPADRLEHIMKETEKLKVIFSNRKNAKASQNDFASVPY